MLSRKKNCSLAEMEIPIYTVDAFSSTPFRGNPAAVCPLPHDINIPDDIKQKIAAEMNLSETAFVQPVKSGSSFEQESHFNLRWFTPTNEVRLCGHATLATSAVLIHVYGNKSKELSFNTLSGELHASYMADGLISLDLPLNKSVPVKHEEFGDLIKAVLGDIPFQEVQYSQTTKKLLIRLSDHLKWIDLQSLHPDSQNMLASKSEKDVTGVIVTLKGSTLACSGFDSKDYDFGSRYFSPWNGIPEDPVTGAAHTVLAPYWADVLGNCSLFAHQFSKRGGDLHIKVKDNGRISLAGHAAVVLRGTITIPSIQ